MRKRLSFVLILLLLSIYSHGEAGNTVEFSTPFPLDFPMSQKYKLLYTEAFGRMGYAFKLIAVPAKRAVALAANGSVHGEVGRIYNYRQGSRYYNLVRVNEEISRVDIVAYGIDSLGPYSAWTSLKDTNLKVGFHRGMKIIEINLSKIMNEKNISRLVDIQSGLGMLTKGRIDIFIGVSSPTDNAIKTQFLNHGIRKMGLIEAIPLYPYMNSEYKKMAIQLETVLKEMKLDGSFKRLESQLN